jgi:hypothetical protein
MSWASLSGRRMDSPTLANSKRVTANENSLVSGKTIAPTFEDHNANTATGLCLNFHRLPPATAARRKGRPKEGGSGGAQTWNFPPPFISPRGDQVSIRWSTEIGFNKSSNRKICGGLAMLNSGPRSLRW